MMGIHGPWRQAKAPRRRHKVQRPSIHEHTPFFDGAQILLAIVTFLAVAGIIVFEWLTW